jgi:alkylresorcinol/alkylpyrone synthase
VGGGRVTRVVSAASAFPPHVYDQQEITTAFAEVVLDAARRDDHRVLERIHQATGVRRRHLALPLETYAGMDGFGATNDAFIEVGVDLGAEAVSKALAEAGLAPADVDVVMTTTVTGVAAPTLDARLVPRIGLRPDVRRVPMFGLGCVAGAAGVARLHDLVAGDPDAVAVLLSVELCSLTVQRDDASMANLVASGLFGDGAAAVVLVGDRRAAALGLDGPAVLASRSRLYPDTERVMGWDIGGSGFRIVLAASVADVVEEHLGHDVTAFLGDHDLKVADVAGWVAHPGGPKVLHAMTRTLGLPPDALDRTWRSLEQVGNLSSASVLHVLAARLAEPRAPAAAYDLVLAMGPGFCSELVLLRW